MRYEYIGEFAKDEAREIRNELQVEYGRLLAEKKDLYAKYYSSDEERQKRLFEINQRMLEIDYERAVQGNIESIASINANNKGKFIKQSINKYEKSIENYNLVKDDLMDIKNNPLITGELTNILGDMKDIRVLESMTHLLKSKENEDRLKKTDPQIQSILDIVEEVAASFRNVISQIQVNLDNKFKQMTDLTDGKKISYGEDLSAFKKSTKIITSINRNKANLNNIQLTDAKDLLKTIDIVERTEKKANRAPKEVNKGVISSNVKTAELVQYIELINTYLGKCSIMEAQKSYNGYTVDFSKAIEDTKKAIQKLEEMKAKFENKLETSGFNKEINAIDVSYKNRIIVDRLAIIYEKMNRASGTKYQELENEIENILAEVPKDKWDAFKIDAKNLAKQKLDMVDFDKISKFKEKKSKEDRDIAILNREGISQSELDSIKREAELAARSRFPEDYQQKSGDIYDLNGGERARFIEDYINRRVQSIVSLRFDEKQREDRVAEKTMVANTDEMVREGITPEMLDLAAEVMKRGDKLEEADVTKLNAEQVREVIKYAKRLKGYSGLSEDALAEVMTRDFLKPGQEMSQRDVMVQKNLNRMYGVESRVNTLFPVEEEDQGMKM